MKTIILSLLSLIFLSGCDGYTKPLVEADEYPINQDLLGIWLLPKEEGKEQQSLKFHKFSDTEYLMAENDKNFARAYEIKFKEKKYLQVEMLYPRKMREGDGLGHKYSDKPRFNIFKYTLSGDNLTLSILVPSYSKKLPLHEENQNPAVDIQREGEDVFYETPMLKRQIDQ
jgi:hypothetical protein